MRFARAGGLATIIVLAAGCTPATGIHPRATARAATTRQTTQAQTTATTTKERSTTAPTAAAVTATTVTLFSPWTSSGTLGANLTVSGHGIGSCFGGSIAVDAPGAWRCTIGNEIYDPCFSPSFSSQSTLRSATVACLANPWSPLTLIELDQPLPYAHANRPGEPPYPWAIALANGQRCVIATGTINSIDGVPLPYGCASGEAGGLSTSAQPWTADYFPNGATSTTSIGVTQAWEG